MPKRRKDNVKGNKKVETYIVSAEVSKACNT